MSALRSTREATVGPVKFAMLKDLRSGGATSPGETLTKLGQLLAAAKLKGSLQLRLVSSGSSASDEGPVFNVTLAAGKAQSGTKPVPKPSVEIVTTPETWNDIASGKLSPLEALVRGRMRLRGNQRLAQLMFQHAAGSEGRTYICSRGED